jgi:tRNA pseudouridine55 synthase
MAETTENTAPLPEILLPPTDGEPHRKEAFAAFAARLKALQGGAAHAGDNPQPPACILAFDKPLGQTSFQLVSKVRWLMTRAMGGRKIKVGHAGTLDPLATGVMVVCTGRATKAIELLQSGVKEYTATLRLGATTPSYDLEHPIDRTYPTAHITEEVVRHALQGFVGEIMQVPPVYSACKIEGKRAYDLVRKGRAEEVELKAKPLRIDEIELTDCRLDRDEISIRVVCSKGTYIRALARDIGEALGSGAHLTALRRTRVGDFRLADCFTVEDFAALLGESSHTPATKSD